MGELKESRVEAIFKHSEVGSKSIAEGLGVFESGGTSIAEGNDGIG